MKNAFSFKVIAKDEVSRGRAGVIKTPHGEIHTPAFVPVGTQATVKSLIPEELDFLGVELFFVNTYHAYLRPGIDVIKKFGGLHAFMHWQKPLITDSGGFQVFSLGAKRMVNIAISESAVLDRKRFTRKQSRQEAVKDQVFPDDYRPVGELVTIDDDGVSFTSHWDGTLHRFTPEVSINLQHQLGADIMIAFDECPPYPTTHEYAHLANERTHAWAQRSLNAHRKIYASNLHSEKTRRLYQALYGVVQGSTYEDLRKKSAEKINAMDFDGIAIGGVAVGESKAEMVRVCDWVVPLLSENKPRHLLGVGEIDDIFAAIERGIDTFDCVQPTRLARMGQVFTSEKLQVRSEKWTMDISKKIFAADTSPIDNNCACYTCQHFSRAYLHHLFRVRELLAYRLATIHNVHFVLTLTKNIRESIVAGDYSSFKAHFLYT
ncbi:tRNA guanosine(34) transglycosylase Tgt [Candidatus Microgenomates bacterium]|nr:MAG: tRNA guanosine(34) transglycosylase Tgt [Candidatus Microgenomates bacterium]